MEVFKEVLTQPVPAYIATLLFGALFALGAFVVWIIKQFVSGCFVTKAAHERALDAERANTEVWREAAMEDRHTARQGLEVAANFTHVGHAVESIVAGMPTNYSTQEGVIHEPAPSRQADPPGRSGGGLHGAGGSEATQRGDEPPPARGSGDS